MAGFIPQNFIDDLITRTNIVEVINTRVPLKKKGREYSACCPFHNEKTPSFTVSENKQFYYCFGCHAKGNAIGFLMDYEHLGYVDAIETLAGDLHLDVPYENSAQGQSNTEDKRPYYDILKQASALYCQQLKQSKTAINYLKNRGLSGEIVQRFNIGYAPNLWDFLPKEMAVDEVQKSHLLKMGLIINKENQQTYDRFRDRIMFPIIDQRGRVIGFGGRIIDQGEPKYLNSAENTIFHKGYELYGLYQTKQALRTISRILIVEGYMDVVALAQHGIDYAVASLGTATTPEQIQKAFRTTQEIVFCYDGDNAGKKAAWRALENTLSILRDGMVAKFLFLPDKEDPDTMIRKEGKLKFEQRILNATPLSDFLFTNLQSQADISTKEGKAQLGKLGNNLLSKMHSSLFKDMLLQELASIVGLSEEKLSTRIINTTKFTSLTNKIEFVKKQSQAPSKTRLAIALLLQNPALTKVQKIPEAFKTAFKNGLPLLYQLQLTIENNPDISSAALLERYRDTSNEKVLNKLSMLSTPETNNPDTIKDDYYRIIQSLIKQDRYEYLTDKINNNQALSDEETQEYLTISKK